MGIGFDLQGMETWRTVCYGNPVPFAFSFPMAAACGKSSILPEDIQRYEAAGLELDHTYSILDVMTTLVGSRYVLMCP